MTDYDDAHPNRVPASRTAPTNPYTTTLGVTGLIMIVVGLLLMLIPTDSYSESIDITRVLAGVSVTSVGGTLITCWLVLAGMGWYLRHQR